MIPLAVKRKLSCLPAYLAAQICGVIPLVSSGSAHVAISVAVCCENVSDSGPHRHDHHAGDTDDVAHHHVLQDLTGIIAGLPTGNEIPVVHIVVTEAAPRPFTRLMPPV
jgi:hypothetical protein